LKLIARVVEERRTWDMGLNDPRFSRPGVQVRLASPPEDIHRRSGANHRRRGNAPPLRGWTEPRLQMLGSAMYAVLEEDMRIDQFAFGSIRIDGVVYEADVVIARGQVRKRKKKASRPFRDAFGHTPLSLKEDIPWDCRRLVVGTGADGALPVMDEVKSEAARREVALVTLPTREAVRALREEPKSTNAILHLTC
jgi:hypothetical protein